ncbi:hypothetical protein ACEU6E_05560 [Halorutilales archaeon Cl-col2-1]
MAEKILDRIFQRPFHSLKKAPSLLWSRSLRHNVARQLNKTWHTKNGRHEYNPEGVDIFEEDWDNLVILDACRFDFFAKAYREHDLPGKLESRISRGSQTPEWLWANFADRTLHDTVYISASFMPYHIGIERFDDPTPFQERYSFDLDVFDLVRLREDLADEVLETYDERLTNTVLPAEATVNGAIEAAKEYPNKRLIIHIIQPHKPYLGSVSRFISSHLTRGEIHIWVNSRFRKKR